MIKIQWLAWGLKRQSVGLSTVPVVCWLISRCVLPLVHRRFQTHQPNNFCGNSELSCIVLLRNKVSPDLLFPPPRDLGHDGFLTIFWAATSRRSCTIQALPFVVNLYVFVWFLAQFTYFFWWWRSSSRLTLCVRATSMFVARFSSVCRLWFRWLPCRWWRYSITIFLFNEQFASRLLLYHVFKTPLVIYYFHGALHKLRYQVYQCTFFPTSCPASAFL